MKRYVLLFNRLGYIELKLFIDSNPVLARNLDRKGKSKDFELHFWRNTDCQALKYALELMPVVLSD